jgi:hypothetical protein
MVRGAVEAAAFIATSDVAAPAAAKALRFWQLSWSVMGLVENQQVTDAMIAFGGKLGAKESPSSLLGAALFLARACRQEMADSWSPIWRR